MGQSGGSVMRHFCGNCGKDAVSWGRFDANLPTFERLPSRELVKPTSPAAGKSGRT
jgi:hypothetical protein